jgi:hypothetical protein
VPKLNNPPANIVVSWEALMENMDHACHSSNPPTNLNFNKVHSKSKSLFAKKNLILSKTCHMTHKVNLHERRGLQQIKEKLTRLSKRGQVEINLWKNIHTRKTWQWVQEWFLLTIQHHYEVVWKIPRPAKSIVTWHMHILKGN